MAASVRPNRSTVIAVAAAVLVVAVAVVIALGFDQTPAVAPGPAMTATPLPSGTATDGAPDPGTGAGDAGGGGEPQLDPRFGEPVADSVARDRVAQFGDGVSAAVTGVAPFTATGAGIGEVAGLAVRVTVTVTNGSSAAVSLDATTVNAYFGSDETPASPLASDGSSAPFSGSLAPGATATGVYAFGIADGADDTVVVTVGRGAGSPLVVFGR